MRMWPNRIRDNDLPGTPPQRRLSACADVLGPLLPAGSEHGTCTLMRAKVPLTCPIARIPPEANHACTQNAGMGSNVPPS